MSLSVSLRRGGGRPGCRIAHAVRMASAVGGGGSREAGSAKATVADQICQAAQLAKLPKNLLAKATTIKNTGQVLEQLPWVILSLDAYMDSGLKRCIFIFLEHEGTIWLAQKNILQYSGIRPVALDEHFAFQAIFLQRQAVLALHLKYSGGIHLKQ